MGDAKNDELRVGFDSRLKLKFCGSKVTADAGLLAYRELDEALGLTEMGADRLQDSRLGQNKQHQLLPLLRQSIYSRLAGYEDVNDAGIGLFVNLMEEDETNYAGTAFVTYADVAGQHSPGTRMSRHAIRDLSVPSRATMTTILDSIDNSMASDDAVYVHCWGGVGRTGTVIGCWLLRHGLASPSNVLDVLRELRQQDQERRHRISPETPEQRQFVQQWLAKGAGA